METLKHSLRRLRRAPALTFTAILTLAIAIGPNTAIFTIIWSVLIKPLPYPEADRLVGVWHHAPGLNTGGAAFSGGLNCSPGMYFTYREANRTFEHFGLWTPNGATVTGVGEPELVPALGMTFGVLDAVGVRPALGRWFSEEDDTPGRNETAILTHGYWQRRFGSDSQVIGRPITVDGRVREIVGVMPAAFTFWTNRADLILPLRFDRNRLFLGNFSFQGLARLKPGVTLEQANADVARMLPTWLTAWQTPPGMDRTLFESARLAPNLHLFKEDIIGNIGEVLWVLLGTIGIVLLIACANVANLLLVRAEGRQQELAVRAALGASRGRIARELLLDAVLLSSAGGLVGLVLAQAALKLLVAIGPATLPRLGEVRIEGITLAYAAGISLLSALVFGLVPIVKYASPRIASGLSGKSRTSSHSRERHRARNALVVVQVALALVLLVGAGLIVRSFLALRDVRPGFTRPEAIQLARIVIPSAQVAPPEDVMRMEQAMLEKVAALPGVSSAAAISSGPMERFDGADTLLSEDKTYGPGEIPPIRRFKFVTPGFFAAVGTDVLAGRDLNWTDLYERRPVALISHNLARELWGSAATAIGKRIREGTASTWREVVGVVRDIHDNGVHEQPPTTVYWPALMDRFWGDSPRVQRSVSLVIRSERASTAPFLDEVRAAVWSINPNVPLALVRTVKDVYAASMARTSFTLVMLAIAGVMALVLGIVGIYGVVSYGVLQRTKEIGIRMALGASERSVGWMVVRYGLLLAGIGAAVGVLTAGAMTRVITSLLFNVSPLDLATYAAVVLALIGTAVLASALPAWRAARVNPIDALRAE